MCRVICTFTEFPPHYPIPLSVTAAANRGDLPAAVNIAALQFVGISAFLVGPPLIGFIAEAGGLRLGLAVLLPIVALSGVMARELASRKPAIPTPATIQP